MCSKSGSTFPQVKSRILERGCVISQQRFNLNEWLRCWSRISGKLQWNCKASTVWIALNWRIVFSRADRGRCEKNECLPVKVISVPNRSLIWCENLTMLSYTPTSSSCRNWSEGSLLRKDWQGMLSLGKGAESDSQIMVGWLSIWLFAASSLLPDWVKHFTHMALLWGSLSSSHPGDSSTGLQGWIGLLSGRWAPASTSLAKENRVKNRCRASIFQDLLKGPEKTRILRMINHRNFGHPDFQQIHFSLATGGFKLSTSAGSLGNFAVEKWHGNHSNLSRIFLGNWCVLFRTLWTTHTTKQRD